MTRRKQPSKRAREMAARYCDAATAYAYAVGASPFFDYQLGPESVEILHRLCDDKRIIKLSHRRAAALSWAEMSAWLRSGEDLP